MNRPGTLWTQTARSMRRANHASRLRHARRVARAAEWRSKTNGVWERTVDGRTLSVWVHARKWVVTELRGAEEYWLATGRTCTQAQRYANTMLAGGNA